MIKQNFQATLASPNHPTDALQHPKQPAIHTLAPSHHNHSTQQNNKPYLYPDARWKHHQTRRISRLNSMIRVRRGKLQDITHHNHMILNRITQQQSHYSTISMQRVNKQESGDQTRGCAQLGPIGEWRSSSSFLMSGRTKRSQNEQELEERLPVIHSKNPFISNLDQAQKQKTTPLVYGKAERKQSVGYGCYRRRQLSDIYLIDLYNNS